MNRSNVYLANFQGESGILVIVSVDWYLSCSSLTVVAAGQLVILIYEAWQVCPKQYPSYKLGFHREIHLGVLRSAQYFSYITFGFIAKIFLRKAGPSPLARRPPSLDLSSCHSEVEALAKVLKHSSV